MSGLFISVGLLGLWSLNQPDALSFLNGNITWLNTRPAHRLGTITRKSGQVRHRAADHPVWYDLGALGQGVSAGDLIFTGNESSAQLAWDGGTRAEIGPSSLIQLQDVPFGAQPVARLTQGRIRFHFKAKAAIQPISLKVGERVVRLVPVMGTSANGTAEIAVDPLDSRRFTVTPGRVPLDVLTDDAKVRLAPDQAALADSAGDLVMHPRLISLRGPRDGETVHIHPERPEVNFSWKAGSSDGSRFVRLEIEGEAPESRRELEVEAKTEVAHVSLRDGAYRWRLKERSPWQFFKVRTLHPPRILGPQPGSIIAPEAKSDQARVPFTWSPPEAGLRPKLEIVLQESRKAPASLRESVPHPAGEIFELERGSYLWRVGVFRPGQEEVSWGPWSDFKIGEILSSVEAAKLPRIETPEAVVSTELKEDGKPDQLRILIRWKAVRLATNYEVTIFDGKGSILERKPVGAPTMTFVAAEKDLAGLSYEVGAVLASGKIVRSQRTPIRIDFSSPRLLYPKDGDSPAIGESVTLAWKKTSLTQHYEVQLGTHPEFNRLLVNQRSQRNWTHFTPDAVGTYHWRVRSITQGRKSAWSETRTLEVRQAP